MEQKRKKIVALIPCYNEERGVAAVLQRFPHDKIAAQGFDLESIVIDNNSTDNTAAVARSLGATVIHEPKKGKGNAMRRGFYAIPDDADYIVMLDGDDTYRPEEMLRLVELLDSGFCSVAIGSRLGGRVVEGSMPFVNRVGNWIFSHLVRFFYRANVTDVLTGYFAWDRRALERLRPHLVSEGFAIEMEMVTKLARLGEDIYCVPITYVSREGKSNLRPFYDGLRILWMGTKNFFWRPPVEQLVPPRLTRKRLVVVAPYFYPKIGGLEKYAHTVATGMAASGEWEVSIVTSNHEGRAYKKEVVDGMTVHRLPAWWILSNTPINPLWFFWLRRFYRQERPDLIHVHSPVPFIADMATFAAGSIPVVMTYHAGSMAKGRTSIDLLIRLYEKTVLRAVFRRVDAIVAVSAAAAPQELASVQHKVHYISPSVAIESFTPTPLPTRREKVVLFVGRIEQSSAWKGIDPLLQSIALLRQQMPQVRLHLVGSGDAVEQYRARATALGIGDYVSFAGTQRGADLAQQYANADVVVLPSTSASESFGTVLIEAMASGRPVVGSRVGGIPQVIDHEETGLLVPPNDPRALADALARILSDTSLATRLATAGLHKAQTTYTTQIQHARYRSLYANMLQQTQSVPVVHLSAYYPPHTGGLERVAQMCVEGLAARGYPTRIITTTQSGLAPGTTTTGNITTTVLRSVEVAHTPVAPGLVWELCMLPRGSVLHIHLAQAFFPEVLLMVAWLRGMRYVVHFHLDVAPSGTFGRVFVLYKRIVWHALLQHAAHVISCAQDQVTILEQKFGVPPERVTVIPNAVGTDFFSNRVYQPSDDTLRILSIGRLSAQKRIDRLLEACALLTIPYTLTITGDGEERAALEELATRRGLTNVVFVGKKTDREMQALHRTHDLFVVPSDKEGMPLAVLEAMAAGLPILATRVEGLAELLDGVGVLVDAPYEQALARAIEQLWHDKTQLVALSRKSIAKAATYRWERFIDSLLSVYTTYVCAH